MRAQEFITESVNLFEVNMSPGSLRQLASSIDARAGMEFEMIVSYENFKTKKYNFLGRTVTAPGNIYLVGKSFENYINRPVNVSTRYHQAPRNPGEYALEPDGSVLPTTDDPDDMSEDGLEFISPPLPIAEMLSDLKKVKEWANLNNCYTNKSCGLHMNVSIPGMQENLENLDYIKLVLLLGDNHVLQEFGRLGNAFAESSFKHVKAAVYDNPQIVDELLDQMKTKLSTLANKLTKDFIHQKHVSVHAKQGYIEFRSPGGDWLDTPTEQLENTLLRFVVALDAAMDPEKYRQEYLKKLYKVLQVKKLDSKDPISYFAKYAAGIITKERLKVLLTNLRSSTEQSQPVQSNNWAIVSDGVILTFVRANTPQVAQSQGYQWLHGKSIEWLNQHFTGRMSVVQASDPIVKTLPRVAD